MKNRLIFGKVKAYKNDILGHPVLAVASARQLSPTSPSSLHFQSADGSDRQINGPACVAQP